MESRLSQLKSNFGDISDIRTQVNNFFEILQIRIIKLKFFYSDFIKTNKTELFVFGLDSLHFQSKLIDIEYDDMKRLFLAINNRMYCEYFKLYKIIVAYIYENTFDKKIMEFIKVNNFPIYKDLEPFKEYNFDIVLEIHENILLMLNAIIGYLEGKEHELTFHTAKKNIGLNIDNFISSFNFDITIIKEKVNLFVTYIEFFHKLHTKQLQRFSNKIQLMYSHVNKDIRFDESINIDEGKKNDSGSEKHFKQNINVNVDNLSDTDVDNISLNSPFENEIFVKRGIIRTPNSILSLTNNNFNIKEEEEENNIILNEEFLNIESKCELLLNSIITEEIPGITIEKIVEDIVIVEPIVEPEVAVTIVEPEVVVTIVNDVTIEKPEVAFIENIQISIIEKQPIVVVNENENEQNLESNFTKPDSKFSHIKL